MNMSRRSVLRFGAATAGGLLASEWLAACGGDGATPAPLDPDALSAFRPSATAGGATGLPSRIAWASTADSEFFLDLGRGMQQAATERGIDYVTATSGNAPARHVDQMNHFLDQGVGAMAMQPLSPEADAVVLQRAIDRGVCAQGIITGPSTMQVVASQYQIGYDQGKAAADY